MCEAGKAVSERVIGCKCIILLINMIALNFNCF